MRPIKFRAWSAATQHMFEPDTLIFKLNGNIVVEKYNSSNRGDTFALETRLPIDEKTTLMQFTGLLDKNGKEIYEGDIVQLIGWSKPVEVAYDKNGFYLNDGTWSNWDGPEVEVIGNIYENQDLLTKS